MRPLSIKRNAGAEKHGFVKVVGDKDGGLTELTDESGEFFLKIGAGDGIEGAEWLVEQNDRRISRERTRDTDTLTLAAGKLVRKSVGESAWIETDEPEHFAGPL